MICKEIYTRFIKGNEIRNDNEIRTDEISNGGKFHTSNDSVAGSTVGTINISLSCWGL